MLELPRVALLACPALTGIHAYLGLHVLRRGVIFVDPERAFRRGRRLRDWPFRSEVTFGIVVTRSVTVGAVLLVFPCPFAPAAVSALLGASLRAGLLIGGALDVIAGMLGPWASFAWELPTGPAVVAAFGTPMIIAAIGLGLRRPVARVRGEEWRAFTGLGAGASGLAAPAGLLLVAVPRMERAWCADSPSWVGCKRCNRTCSGEPVE